jgi:hypothetical protein
MEWLSLSNPVLNVVIIGGGFIGTMLAVQEKS